MLMNVWKGDNEARLMTYRVTHIIQNNKTRIIIVFDKFSLLQLLFARICDFLAIHSNAYQKGSDEVDFLGRVLTVTETYILASIPGKITQHNNHHHR
jgi:hypothetical protein